MNFSISHDRKDETIEEKTRWFRSLSLSERMDLLCWFTDLTLQNNPELPDTKDAQSANGSILVLSKA